MDPFAELIELLTGDGADDALASLTRSEIEEHRQTLIDGIRRITDEAEDAEGAEADTLIEAAESASELLARLDARLEEIGEEEEGRRTRLADVIARIAPEDQDEGGDDEAAGDDGEEEDGAEAPEAEVETTEEEEVPERQAANTDALRRFTRRPARRDPRPAPETTARFSVTASVESPEHSTGASIESPDEVARMLLSRHQAVAGAKVTGTENYPVVRLSVDHGDYEMNRDPVHNQEVIDRLRRDFAQQSLTADGGFCAPGQPSYDFFNITTRDGLLSLPTAGAPRGNVIIPVSPSIQDVFSTSAWNAAVGPEYTEAQDIAGTDKACYTVTCPDTEPFQISAYPTCLIFGNFAARAWPEFVANTVRLSLDAHAHRVNASIISKVVALADSVGPPVSPGGGTISSLLANLAFYAALYRDRYRMGLRDRLTLVAPAWVLEALAADYVRRASSTTFDGALGAVNAWLTSRGIDPQWVYDWQGLATAPEIEFPGTADFLLYASGTVIRLDGGTLDLGVVRDSTLNVNNNFQQFVETFDGVAKVGHEVMLVENLETCPSGATGQAEDLGCVGS